MVFIDREITVGNKFYFMRTSGETDVRLHLKLKISTYPSQRPDGPSLSPYFLFLKYNEFLEK